jgi:hypothetical protein
MITKRQRLKKRATRKRATYKRTQKGGELEPSPYYYVSKSTYSGGDNSFNLYGKQRVMNMLKIIDRPDAASKYLEEFNSVRMRSNTLLQSILKHYDVVFADKLDDLTDDEKTKYVGLTNTLFSKNKDYVSKVLINYQIETDADMMKIKQTIDDYINAINTLDASYTTKYEAYKHFLQEIFNDDLFSINSLNFLTLNELKKKLTFIGKPPLTPGETKFNKYVEDVKEYYRNIENLKNELSITLLPSTLRQIYEYYMETEFPSIVKGMVQPAENEHLLVLNKNSKIYRCVPASKKNTLTETGKSFLWYGFEPLSILNYALPEYVENSGISNYCNEYLGYIGTYVVNQDLQLLNLLNITTLDYLKTNVKDEQVLQAIDKIVYVEDNIVKRKSVLSDDKTFVRWLCKNGFNGYMSVNDAGGTLHPEICICNPDQRLEPYNADNVTPLNKLFHFCDGTQEVDFFITNP